MLMFVVLVLMLWQNFTTTGRNLAKPGSLCCGAAATRCCLKALVLVPVNWSNTGITGTTGRNSDSQFSCCDFIVCFVEVLFCFLFMFILCLSMKTRERGGGQLSLAQPSLALALFIIFFIFTHFHCIISVSVNSFPFPDSQCHALPRPPPPDPLAPPTWVSVRHRPLASCFLSAPTTQWFFSKARSSRSSCEGEKAVRIRLGFLEKGVWSSRLSGPPSSPGQQGETHTGQSLHLGFFFNKIKQIVCR